MTAYVVVEVEVSDPEAYVPYVEGATTSVASSGGRYLARGGRTESLEGDPPRSRVVVLEFPDLEAATAWYHSDAYQAIVALRTRNSDGGAFIVEGVAPDYKAASFLQKMPS